MPETSSCLTCGGSVPPFTRCSSCGAMDVDDKPQGKIIFMHKRDIQYLIHCFLYMNLAKKCN